MSSHSTVCEALRKMRWSHNVEVVEKVGRDDHR